MTDTQTAVQYDKGADGIVVLTLDDPTASANTMNDLYLDSMHEAVDRLYAEAAQDADSVAGVVITSAKKTFFAGGNLKNMLKAGPDDVESVFQMGERVKADLRRLETSRSPSSRRSTAPRSVAASRSPWPASTAWWSTTRRWTSVSPR
jgi:3-hydroxyacyl-CoA dehydrogenase/enoyl-CoA hydratase/3-hydroxybutyryl-CoA epimerase